MIKIRYPLSGEQHELFNDQIEALGKQFFPYKCNNDNIRCFYCRSDDRDDIYLVYFNYYVVTAVDMIVHWNGERMLYQISTECKEFIYEPKKSLKVECLGLVKDAVETLNGMFIYTANDSDRRTKIKLCLDKLDDNINKIKHNT